MEMQACSSNDAIESSATSAFMKRSSCEHSFDHDTSRVSRNSRHCWQVRKLADGSTFNSVSLTEICKRDTHDY